MRLNIKSTEHPELSWNFVIERVPDEGLVKLVSLEHPSLTSHAPNLHEALYSIMEQTKEHKDETLRYLSETIRDTALKNMPRFQGGEAERGVIIESNGSAAT